MLVTEKGVIPYAFGFEEISFLRDLEPGDPQAWVKLAEAMESQEMHMHILEPNLNDFKDDSLRLTCIDSDKNIQALSGIPREGESYHPIILLFPKSMGWEHEKIKSWLQDNPQYAVSQRLKATQSNLAKPATQADVSIVNVPSSTPEKEIKIN